MTHVVTRVGRGSHVGNEGRKLVPRHKLHKNQICGHALGEISVVDPNTWNLDRDPEFWSTSEWIQGYVINFKRKS